MVLKRCLISAFISFFIFSNSTAQIKVVEEKKIEHNGAVSTSITQHNKIITYSIVSEKGSDDKIEIVAYDEHFKEGGRFETKCAEKCIYKTNALSGSGDYYFSLIIIYIFLMKMI